MYLTLFFGYLGNWTTAFQAEKTSLQEFHVDERTTVMTPMMTRTGHYHYWNDKVNPIGAYATHAAMKQR